jgi:kanamycin kinase
VTADFADLAAFHTLGDQPVPGIVRELAADDGVEPVLAWRNDLGGLTFRLRDRHVKWNPRTSGIDLARERDCLAWLSQRHPAPRVLLFGTDAAAQWLVTASLPGGHAVGDTWRARRPEAIAAIAAGLLAIHALPVRDVPAELAEGSWATRTPGNLGPRPPVLDPVVVHGDACAPNTLIDDAGRWTGHVDLGDQAELFEAYGIEPDEERIRYYRALWEQES